MVRLSSGLLQVMIYTKYTSKVNWAKNWSFLWSAVLNGEAISKDRYFGNLKSMTSSKCKDSIAILYVMPEGWSRFCNSRLNCVHPVC